MINCRLIYFEEKRNSATTVSCSDNIDIGWTVFNKFYLIWFDMHSATLYLPLHPEQQSVEQAIHHFISRYIRLFIEIQFAQICLRCREACFLVVY